MSNVRAALQVRSLLAEGMDRAILATRGIKVDAILRARTKEFAETGWFSESMAYASLVSDGPSLVQTNLTRLAKSLNGTGSGSLVKLVNGQAWLADLERDPASGPHRNQAPLGARGSAA
jgi:hypothetical protein